ncbi:MAG TPA: hypothetical protein VG839_03785 [Asticcacaulis sp.]|nr:hypothetical protein [Asticcacaulis sp.]
MTQTIFRNGFFAFLAMILVAVGVALILNAPPEPSHAAQPAAADDGDDFAPADSDSKPIDARLEYDAPAQ